MYLPFISIYRAPFYPYRSYERKNIMKNITESRERVRRIVFIALFTALAFVSRLVIQIPVMFLTLDVKDSIIILLSMFFGPVAGAVSAFLAALIEFITAVSDTGIYGFIMNFVSSATFSITAGTIYKYRRTFKGGIVALLTGVVTVTAFMLLANIVVTPFFMKSSVEAVLKLIPKVLLPFNFLKATLNASIVLALYKPLSNALKSIGVIKKGENEKLSFGKTSVLTLIIAIIIALASLTIIYATMK